MKHDLHTVPGAQMECREVLRREEARRVPLDALGDAAVRGENHGPQREDLALEGVLDLGDESLHV